MTDSTTLLLVEDDLGLRTFLADNLTADGFNVLLADSVRDAVRLLEYKQPDLALVDLGLPDGSGLDLIRQRARGRRRRLAARPGPAARDPHRPRGRARPRPRVRARRGRLRLQALLLRGAARPRARRSCAARQPRQALGRLRVGDLEIDPPSREVRLRGRRVELSQKEFALLEGAGGRRRRACSRRRSCCATSGASARMGATRTLDSHACRLRQKLGTARRPLRRERVGRRLPARRRAGRGGGGVSGLALVGLARRRGLRGGSPRCCRRGSSAARRSSPTRATSCAGRCARRGWVCTALDDAERAAAVDLELRRAALALDDLAAAARGRRAGERAQLVDVGALLDDAAEAWRPLARAFGAELAVEPLRGRALVRADPVRLAQACGNLVANAVEHGGVARAGARARARGAGARRGRGRGAGAARAGAGAGRRHRRSARARARRGRARPAPRAAAASPSRRGIAERHGGRLAAAPSAAGACLVLELPGADGSGPARSAPMSRRRRGALLIGLALALGGLAASDVGRREAAVRAQLAPLVDVVVAGRDLAAAAAARGRRTSRSAASPRATRRSARRPCPRRSSAGGRPRPCPAARTSARASSRTSRRPARRRSAAASARSRSPGPARPSSSSRARGSTSSSSRSAAARASRSPGADVLAARPLAARRRARTPRASRPRCASPRRQALTLASLEAGAREVRLLARTR